MNCPSGVVEGEEVGIRVRTLSVSNRNSESQMSATPNHRCDAQLGTYINWQFIYISTIRIGSG
jgi:hypothetical protein